MEKKQLLLPPTFIHHEKTTECSYINVPSIYLNLRNSRSKHKLGYE